MLLRQKFLLPKTNGWINFLLLKFSEWKCTKQVIGLNKFARMGKEITASDTEKYAGDLLPLCMRCRSEYGCPKTSQGSGRLPLSLKAMTLTLKKIIQFYIILIQLP